MGDKAVKKTTLYTLFLFTALLFGEDIDTILTKITKKRVSHTPPESILATPSPMPKLIKSDENSSKSSKDKNISSLKAKEINFKLIAIMNNSANINGHWYKLGQKVGSYTLEDIMDDSVFLKSGQKEKILFFDQNRSKINIILGR